MPEKGSHCSYCGSRYHAQQPWPRTCRVCGETTYLNPVPVTVVLVPVDEGLLTVRRGVSPLIGELALPGGYIDLGETWQEAGAREVHEETGLVIDPEDLQLFWVQSDPYSTLLIFGEAGPISSAQLPPFTPTNETSERVVISQLRELAFPLHTRAAALFFERRTETAERSGDSLPEMAWKVWYEDLFDRETPRQVVAQGEGLVAGLVELWGRHLFETVQPGGASGFSRFNLFADHESIEIRGDKEGAARLREWVFGAERRAVRGFQEAGDMAFLQRLARAHARLLQSNLSAEHLLALASRHADRGAFEQELAEGR